MTHWHLNERIDDGNPVNNGTDRHRDCLADAVSAIMAPMNLMGWVNTLFNILDIRGTTEYEFTYTDNCDNAHILRMSIWACTCSDGEALLRDRERRAVAHLN